MVKNYLKLVIRNLIKQKTYSLINIFGLAFGLAVSIVIGAYIYSEVSYDTFHDKVKRIYRVGTFLEFGGNGMRLGSTSFRSGPALNNEYPEVEHFVRLRRFADDTPVKYGEKKYFEKDVFYADPSYFELFSYKIHRGNPETALKDPFSVVITKSIANKYFGETNPIGKVLELSDYDKTFTVTAVIEDMPRNSHFTFTMLCSFESMREKMGNQMTRWMGDFQNYTYILLDKECDYKSLEAKFPALIEKNLGELLTATNGKVELFLQPLKEIYLYSNTLNEIAGSGDIRYIYIFSAIGILILLIACINYMNLTTARSIKRSREVGIKKVHGVQRFQLVFQFLWESLFFTILSVFSALVLIVVLWPYIQNYTGIDVSVLSNNIMILAGGLITLSFLVSLVAGIYPAMYLSSFQPAESIKGLQKGKKGTNFRNTLVIVQFIISISLIGCTFIINNQLNYLQNKKLGFKKENIVVVPFDYLSSVRSVQSLKNDLLSYSDITGVATSSAIPGYWSSKQNLFGPEGMSAKDAPIIHAINVDKDFLPTMNIQLIAGRNFSDKHSTDPTQSILINETAAKRFGWEDPIGKRLIEWTDNSPTKTIIGVVEDYHFLPLQYQVDPLVIEDDVDRFGVNYFLVSITGNDIKESLNVIQSIMENENSLLPYDYFFLDKSFDDLYRSEINLGHTFSCFTSFAIFLACLGLFGLAVYAAEQRTKEIGIRKVLGATVPGILTLLTKNFTEWILLANIIAWPIAYYATNKWLQTFAYRIDITIWPFILAGMTALVIALLTVSWQALRAATANPVESLRYE